MGADSNNPFGQAQPDATAVKGLSIGYTDLSHDHNIPKSYDVSTVGLQGAGGVYGLYKEIPTQAQITNTGAASVSMYHTHNLTSTDSETRSKNVRMNWIIKY